MRSHARWATSSRRSGAEVWLERLIFLPERGAPPAPPGVEDRWLTTRDGVRIHAWHVAAPRASATLVWSHGNAGNIAGRVDIAFALAARGLDVLAYDYRGYGRSDGIPSEKGVYLDAEAAYEEAARRRLPVIAFGESLGGAVSIELATVRPCAAVAAVSTWTRLQDVARRHYGPLAAIVGDRFDSLARIGTLSVPLLVAHGDADDIVPFALGERLFAAAREPKRFLRVPGAGHNDVFERTEVLDGVADFVATVCTDAEPRGNRRR